MCVMKLEMLSMGAFTILDFILTHFENILTWYNAGENFPVQNLHRAFLAVV